LLMYKEYNEAVSGNSLNHLDWQVIHAPGLQLYIFQKDEAGELETDVLAEDPWPCNQELKKCNFLLCGNKNIKIVKINIDCLDGTLFMAENGDLYFRRGEMPYNQFWFLSPGEQKKWVKKYVFFDNCLSCDFVYLENIMYKTTIKYGGPTLIMILGAFSVLATASGALGASPLALIFGVSSGDLSIAVGFVEILLNLTGNEDQIKLLPKGIFDVIIMMPVRELTNDRYEYVTIPIEFVLTVVEKGRVTIRFKGLNDIEKIDAVLSDIGIMIEGTDDVNKIMEKFKQKGITVKKFQKR